MEPVIDVIISPGSGIYQNYHPSKIEKKLRKKLGSGFNYLVSENKEDLGLLSHESVLRGAQVILVSSGDTGANEVLERIIKRDVVFGIIPSGTANNLAWSVGMKNMSIACDLYKKISRGEINLEDCVISSDMLEINFDENKRAISASTFNLGYVARICNDAEDLSQRTRIETFTKKLFGKRLIYASKLLKTEKKYKPFDAEITCYLQDGSTVKHELKKLMNASVVKTRCATLDYWDPLGFTYGGRMNVSGFKDRDFLKKAELALKMKLSYEDAHLSKKLGEDGYNKDGVNYVPDLKSLEIRILDPGENDKIFIESGGAPFEIEKPDKPITVTVLPEAIKMIYNFQRKDKIETIPRRR